MSEDLLHLLEGAALCLGEHLPQGTTVSSRVFDSLGEDRAHEEDVDTARRPRRGVEGDREAMRVSARLAFTKEPFRSSRGGDVERKVDEIGPPPVPRGVWRKIGQAGPRERKRDEARHALLVAECRRRGIRKRKVEDPCRVPLDSSAWLR